MEIRIPVGGAEAVFGDLTVPDGATGVVVFAHGSGSGRHSPRNRQVAGALVERGLATLLMDLLTEREDATDRRTAQLRFDIGLLATRLRLAADQLVADPATGSLPVGYFGASTGAAAALVAAGQDRGRVRAVVSRGGRPDLAGDALPRVRAPTLLVVGGRDPRVLTLNRQAIDAMTCERELVVVPGATHLFEEPGALRRVAALAGEWFSRHLDRTTVAEARPSRGVQMSDESTPDQLRQELRDIDAEIAQLRRSAADVRTRDGVEDPEEIAADLTGAEEDEAVLGILEQRREAILKRLGDR